jgi:hypothetical protein
LAAFRLEADFLPVAQSAQARALDRRDVNERIPRSVLRLNETIALPAVEPLHGSDRHCRPWQVKPAVAGSPAADRAALNGVQVRRSRRAKEKQAEPRAGVDSGHVASPPSLHKRGTRPQNPGSGIGSFLDGAERRGFADTVACRPELPIAACSTNKVGGAFHRSVKSSMK